MIRISLVQPDIIWENITANLESLEQLLSDLAGQTDVVLLPELFTTGFTMRSRELAEPMEGKTMVWMKNMVQCLSCDLVGSLIIEENGEFFNRLIWMQKDGRYHHYDKRHLFRVGGENEYYSKGAGQLIVESHGMRFKPLICYDLRFPVWSRNRTFNEYDILVYIASWPSPRRMVWKSLLQARAIENQAYVLGVNRTGKDGMGISYHGDTMAFNARGEELACMDMDIRGHITIQLSKQELARFREKFPVWKDADPFTLED
jgi:predicted amidohydrolase